MSNDQQKNGPHHRPRWNGKDPAEIWVHGRLDKLRGSYRSNARDAAIKLERYERAKYQFDMSAAVEIVEEMIDTAIVDRIIDSLIKVNKPPLIVMPHPEFDSGDPVEPGAALPKNALPFAFANYLAEDLGCDVDEAIVEVNRPGRTQLGRFPRFLWQPGFEGDVSHSQPYIIVDDVASMGGTLASLRSYIVSQGGKVIAASVLANTNGSHQKFGIADDTANMLRSLYGEQIDDLLKGEVGHASESLTETEGQFLCDWHAQECQECGAGPVALQRLRNRFAEIAAKAR